MHPGYMNSLAGRALCNLAFARGVQPAVAASTAAAVVGRAAVNWVRNRGAVARVAPVEAALVMVLMRNSGRSFAAGKVVVARSVAGY